MQKSLVRDCYYQKHALPCEKTASQSLLFSSLQVWSMYSCLRSPALSQVYLSLTFQLSQTAFVKVEMSSTFPTVPVKLNNSQLRFFNEKFMRAMCRKGVSKMFFHISDSDLQYNFRQGWGHAFNGYCNQGGLKNGRRTLKIFWEDWYCFARADNGKMRAANECYALKMNIIVILTLSLLETILFYWPKYLTS